MRLRPVLLAVAGMALMLSQVRFAGRQQATARSKAAAFTAALTAQTAPPLGQTAPPAGQLPARTTQAPVPPPAQPQTPQDARVQQLEQQQSGVDARVRELEERLGALQADQAQQQEAAAQGVQARRELQQLQAAGQGYEAARQARVADFDLIEKELVTLENTMSHGWTVSSEDFAQLQQDLYTLQSNASQTSGRLEVIYISTALDNVTWAREAMEGYDYFVARIQLFSAIDNVVAARNAATGNPMPAWRPQQ